MTENKKTITREDAESLVEVVTCDLNDLIMDISLELKNKNKREVKQNGQTDVK